MHSNSVLAWHVPNLKISPVSTVDWVADVNEGAPVNFNNIHFNPHAHGTHTESIGHISSRKESLNDNLKKFFFVSKLISIKPVNINSDFVINKESIQKLVSKDENIDTLTLSKVLSKLGANSILNAIIKIEKGEARFQEQNHSEATYAKKISKMEGQINWKESAKKVLAKINGLNPNPGAWFEYNKERYKVWNTI